MINLNSENKLTLINRTDMVDTVRDIIKNNFGEIVKEEAKSECFEFQLQGHPWCTSGDEGIKSRKLISRISEAMMTQGWRLTHALDITRNLSDKSVLLYTRSPNVSHNFACVALSDVNKIRLLDFPPEHARVLRDVLQQSYQPGVEKEEQKDESCIEIVLNGYPWSIVATYLMDLSFALHGRSSLLHFLKKANSLGYQLVASADVSSKFVATKHAHYTLDVHSWFFAYQPKYSGAQSYPSKPETKADLYPSLDQTSSTNQPPSYQDAVNDKY